MAKPRIFVSSTYYDLRIVRSDMETAIRELGYEPVLHEKGHVPYSKETSLEDACYREISTVDILVSIIGNRFGANSIDGDHSIAQQELLTALKLDKQVYIFVDRAVYNEYKTYDVNRDNSEIKFAAVDNIGIYKFLDEVFALPFNNATFAFETSHDITMLLREQLAGLFRELLSETAARKSVQLIDELTVAIASLREITGVVNRTIAQDSAAVRDLVLTTHPIFNRLKTLLKVPYRLFFLNHAEMSAWLNARGFVPVQVAKWDDPQHMEFVNDKEKEYLRIAKSLFDDHNRLIVISPDAWDDSMLELMPIRAAAAPPPPPPPPSAPPKPRPAPPASVILPPKAVSA